MNQMKRRECFPVAGCVHPGVPGSKKQFAVPTQIWYTKYCGAQIILASHVWNLILGWVWPQPTIESVGRSPPMRNQHLYYGGHRPIEWMLMRPIGPHCKHFALLASTSSSNKRVDSPALYPTWIFLCISNPNCTHDILDASSISLYLPHLCARVFAWLPNP